MHKWKRIITTLLFGIVWGDNPNSIVKPYDGPDPGYILAESNGGLSNRLRVLASYMHIGLAKFRGAHLVFIWDTNVACPGQFLSVFEQINTVIFATNSSRYVLDKNAKIVYENSFAVMNWILMQNDIPKNKFGFPSWREIEYKMYSRYFPVQEIMRKVNEFVIRHNICNASAMHLRTTDLDRIMGERKRLNIKSFFKFVESRPTDEKIFILTDHPDIQKIFIIQYSVNKIIFYQEIVDTTHQLPTTANNFTSLPIEHRYTSLEHTVIDVIIAAHAKVFKPSPYSSLSELVKIFEFIGKKDRKWCA